MLSSYQPKRTDQEKDHLSIRNERTVKKSVSIAGKALFSGVHVNLKFLPAPEGSGVVFKRVDLPNKPIIPAHVNFVASTPRCTILAKENAVIQSVEHLLSAVKAFNLDNLIIEIDGPEIPIGDGSALPFIEKFNEAGILYQEKEIASVPIKEPLVWEKDEMHLIAIPSKELKFSYTLSYPGHPLLDAQFYSFVWSEERYVEEIAPCRTFSLYEEVVPLLEKGIIKGGTLENGVVIKGQELLNSDGIRFDNEPVRHKILDLIGDISLTGFPVVAHFIAIRSGHFGNTEMAKKIIDHCKVEGLYHG